MARILVADDNETNLKLVRNVLANQGYELIEACDGLQALDLVREVKPDIALLDLKMPGMSGLAVLEAVRADPATRLLPVILLTASADMHDKHRALEVGVTDFINKPFDANELILRVRALLTLKFYTDELENAHDVFVTLAETIDARDSYTASHSSRVAYYAKLLGQRIGLSEEEIKTLRQGAFFHDFGKISVRDSVLLKPGKLTDEEFAHIKIHPVEGRRLVHGMKSLAKAVPVIYHHHEKLDGSGYPDGISGSALVVPVRITAIADVFDALTTDRPYRKAFTKKAALEIMEAEAKKGWWDGKLVDEFRAVAEKL